MRLKDILLLMLTLVLIGQSCRKDNFEKVEGPDQPPVVRNIETTVKGIVKDEDGNTIARALITLGDHEVEANNEGVFSITGLANERNGFLHIKKQGYFDAFPAFTASKEGFARVDVTMISNEYTRLVSGANGGTLELQDGAQVTFPPNSFDLNGNPYLGDVTVRTAYLDPTRDGFFERMPGDLYAINREGQERVLQSFGMLNVEISDGAGQELSLSKEATLKMIVPSDLQNDAPSTIPLWHFDEEKGHWVEEGEAVLNGNTYIGNVAHFTWWNCDVPYELINMSGYTKFNDVSLRAYFCIEDVENSVRKCGYSNANGFYSAKVPKGRILKVVVKNCEGMEVVSGQIDAHETNFQHDIVLNSTDLLDLNQVLISGEIQRCSISEDQGCVDMTITYDSHPSQKIKIFADQDGRFNQLVELNCESALSVFSRPFRLDILDVNNNYCSSRHFINDNEIQCGVLNTCYQDYQFKAILEIAGYDTLEYLTTYAWPIVSNPSDVRSNNLFINHDHIDGLQTVNFTTQNFNDPANRKYQFEIEGGSFEWQVLNNGFIEVKEFSGSCAPFIVEIDDMLIWHKSTNTYFPNSKLYIDAYYLPAF